MKLKYLGTAAAEGIPAVFCDCENCLRSRKLGGKNIRTRSQALVDDTLLIDFPADTYLHYLRENFELSKIKSCLITHSHCDHLYADEIENRKDGFANLSAPQPLTFYSWDSGYKMIMTEKIKGYVPDSYVKAVNIKPFVDFKVEGYNVTPIRAAHDVKSDPVVYAIEKDGKRLLYFNDSSELHEDGMEALRKFRDKPFDLISLDCTMGCNEFEWEGHMGLSRCAGFRDTLKAEGVADEHTIFILNHFSHNGKNVVYDDLVKIAAENDFLVSYDGMEIEF